MSPQSTRRKIEQLPKYIASIEGGHGIPHEGGIEVLRWNILSLVQEILEDVQVGSDWIQVELWVPKGISNLRRAEKVKILKTLQSSIWSTSELTQIAQLARRFRKTALLFLGINPFAYETANAQTYSEIQEVWSWKLWLLPEEVFTRTALYTQFLTWDFDTAWGIIFRKIEQGQNVNFWKSMQARLTSLLESKEI